MGRGALFVFTRRRREGGSLVNKIEQIKAEKGGLEVGRDIPRYAELGVDAIEEGNLERLKWWGIFFRKHTPGHFMMRIRIPNGISSAAQLRTIGRIANRVGRGIADITTRQQIQLRWIRINDVPQILDELREVGLVTLQTGMDNIRNVVGCAVAGLTPNELFDASPVARAFTDTFVGDVAYTNLPRKFNATITGCRENCTHAETQDVALCQRRNRSAARPSPASTCSSAARTAPAATGSRRRSTSSCPPRRRPSSAAPSSSSSATTARARRATRSASRSWSRSGGRRSSTTLSRGGWGGRSSGRASTSADRRRPTTSASSARSRRR